SIAFHKVAPVSDRPYGEPAQAFRRKAVHGQLIPSQEQHSTTNTEGPGKWASRSRHCRLHDFALTCVTVKSKSRRARRGHSRLTAANGSPLLPTDSCMRRLLGAWTNSYSFVNATPRWRRKTPSCGADWHS